MKKAGDGLRVMVAFALHGATVGGIYTRLPEIQRSLGLGESAFGLTLLGFSLGVFLGNVAIAPLIDRFGARAAILWSLPIFAAMPLLATVAPGAVALGVALTAFGIALAAGNVAVNVAGSAVEKATGHGIMNRLHGSWGVGFLLISTIAPALIALGVPPWGQFLGLAALTAAATLAFVAPLYEEPRQQAETRTGSAKGPRYAWPTAAVWMIGAAVVAGVIFEGIARSWGVIYLRDVLGASEALAAAALPAFIVTLTLARFGGDAVVARLGAARVGQGAALVLALGTLVVVAAPGPWLALLGFAVLGLGSSVAVPLGFSAAGHQASGSAAGALAAFSLLTMLFNAVGPPLFGVLAEGTGLRLAMLLFLPLAAVSYLTAARLGARRPPDAAPALS